MDYEKKYKGALKRATQYKESGIIDEAYIDAIFGLAESEDERIKKVIITKMEACAKSSNFFRKEEIEWVKKQNEQKPIKVIYIPKFRSGDNIVSTKNPHLTYIIRKTGVMDESGELCYECEILADGKSDNDIKLLSIEKVDSWGELIEQKPLHWEPSEEEMTAFWNLMKCGVYLSAWKKLRKPIESLYEDLLKLKKFPKEGGE